MSHEIEINAHEVYGAKGEDGRRLGLTLTVLVDGKAENPPDGGEIFFKTGMLQGAVSKGWKEGIFQGYSDSTERVGALRKIVAGAAGEAQMEEKQEV
jgi:hypothetical protein